MLRGHWSGHSGILAILAGASILGLFIADDYGQSWDEIFEDKAGARAISAYRAGSLLRDQDDDYVHGTFYFMLYSGVSRLLSTLPLGLARLAIRHYLNYLTLLLAVASGYYLADRLFGRRPALIAALLMLGQPLFFGHAFINQKDIPFLAFFTASIALAVYATSAIEQRVRHSPKHPPDESRKPLSIALTSMRANWRGAGRSTRVAFLVLGLLGAALSADLLAEWSVYPVLESTLSKAYAQEASEPVNRVFQAIAQDANKTPLAAYQLKLRSAYTLLRATLLPLTLTALIWAWTRMIGPVHVRIPIIHDRALRSQMLAGTLLGLTCAIRVIGPFAGLLAAFYMLLKLKRKALPVILIYGLTAAVVTYLAWPALWGDPIVEYGSRLTGSTRFGQSHEVLFEGEIIAASTLPARYLPKLLVMQFTEPLLLAIPVGLLVALRSVRRRELDGALLVLLALWFGLPLLGQAFLRAALYGNTRQLLFMTVPLVVLAGVGWEFAIQRLERRWVQALVILLAVAPGIYSIIRFHPYQYTYYNQLVGGVRGAEGRYELDYWCTSYRELVGWLNLHAPPNSKVAAWGPAEAAAGFARSDLTVEPEPSGLEDAGYRMACGRGLLEAELFHGTRTVFEVRRAGALLGKLAAVTDGS